MKKNKFKKNDLPGLFLMLGILLMILSFTLQNSWKLDITEESSLQVITGTVIEFNTTNKLKAGPKMHLYLKSLNAIHHLTQNDLTNLYPALLALSPGDIVTAKVEQDCCGRNLLWLWSITVNETNILSYEKTFNSYMYKAERSSNFGVICAYIAMLLFIVGIYLRIKFGSWVSS